MQLKKSLYIVGACAAVLSAASAMAQGSGNSNSAGNGAGAPREWKNGTQVVNCDGTGAAMTPAQVQAMIRQFQTDREAFTASQNALKAQLAGAPEADVLNYHMGAVLVKLGQKDQARERLSKALDGGEDFAGRKEAERLLKELG